MKISVALCTYNGEEFIRNQVDSILIQSIAVSEIIVCDDASTDSTQSILKEYEQAYPGLFRVFCNQPNIGVVRNFEQAIQYCAGDLIFFCDQDDIWEFNKVERVVQYFKNHPGISGLFTNALLIDDTGNPICKTIWSFLQFEEVLQQQKDFDLFRFLLFYRNVVTGACLVIKKEVVPLILPFPCDGRMLHDEWIGLRLAAQQSLGFLNECLVRYRIHSKQVTLTVWQSDLKAAALRSSLIIDDEFQFPFAYYSYWKKKWAFLQDFNIHFCLLSSDIFKELLNKIRRGVLAYLKTQPFIKRKILILKMLYRGLPEINLKDLLVI